MKCKQNFVVIYYSGGGGGGGGGGVANKSSSSIIRRRWGKIPYGILTLSQVGLDLANVNTVKTKANKSIITIQEIINMMLT